VGQAIVSQWPACLEELLRGAGHRFQWPACLEELLRGAGHRFCVACLERLRGWQTATADRLPPQLSPLILFARDKPLLFIGLPGARSKRFEFAIV